MDFSHLADSRSVSWSLAINQASFDLATNASRHPKHRKDHFVHFVHFLHISSISFFSASNAAGGGKGSTSVKWRILSLSLQIQYRCRMPPDAPGCLEPFLNASKIFKMRRVGVPVPRCSELATGTASDGARTTPPMMRLLVRPGLCSCSISLRHTFLHQTVAIPKDPDILKTADSCKGL